MEGETISAFSVELRHMAARCDFGTFLDDALRDRFVAGLSDASIQASLLKKKELSFETACDLARSSELAEKESKGFRPTSDRTFLDEGVHVIQKGQQRQKARTSVGLAAGTSCYRCAEQHDAGDCPYRKARCHYCKMTGHLARACKKKKREAVNAFNDNDEEVEELQLFHVQQSGPTTRPYRVQVHIAGTPVEMQIDTGAAVSIISESVFSSLSCVQPPVKTRLQLRTYGGAPLEIVGQAEVPVVYREQRKTLPVVVVPGRKPSLLGHDWLAELRIDWKSVFTVQTDGMVEELLRKYSDVFSTEVGLIKGHKAQLVLKEDARPVFCKARPVPFSLRTAVEEEIRQLERNGVLVPVAQSDWATPVVVVPKADKKVRLCGDFKVTLNPCIMTEHYPLPLVEDIFAVIAEGKVFTVLDLTTAYQQIEVHPDSQKLLTLNTHIGLFQCLRMPYGISSAPAIFQSVMDQVLKGMKGVACYLDDVLITGASERECFERVEAVLTRFREHGVRLKQEKSKRPDYQPARSSHSVLQLPGRLDQADPTAAREMAALPDRQQGDDQMLQDQSSHEPPASGRLEDDQAISGPESSEQVPVQSTPGTLRRSTRIRKEPDRWGYS
ncbi:uncharacterized protein K02A2.6-like [Dermacentor silvarum]|uniref:uncharacterized protein K02A2.6-like n=1 Tax=Dermacentor silvarum TaxID=543639 RepID=UPI0021011222|nr:uncharacterized protein K02A2.6-like [Dermacentor silvarum]